MLEIYFTFPFIVKICISIRYNSSNFFILQFNPRQDPNYLNLQKEKKKKKKKDQICNNKIKKQLVEILARKAGNEYYCTFKNRSRETLFYTGHWLKLRFTKQFLALHPQLALYSHHSERTHKIYIYISNFCSLEKGGQPFLQRQCTPRKWKIFSKAQDPQLPLLPFLFSRRRPFSFHPSVFLFHPLIFPSLEVFFISIPIVSSSRTMPKLGGNRRKALVAPPFFPIPLPYCLSLANTREWIRLTARLLAIVIN